MLLKCVYFVLIFLLHSIPCLIAQNYNCVPKDAISNSSLNLDTIIFYDVAIEGPGYSFRFTSDTCSTYSYTKERGDAAYYFINCNEVSKDIYDSIKQINEGLQECKPCVVKHFDENNNLVSINYQYQDCYIGNYIEFYPETTICKITGNYRFPLKSKWNYRYLKDFCGVKVGEWYFYNEDGSLKYIEVYENGLLVSTDVTH